MRKDIIEIRWHGRGGQGAITAAKIVANGAFASGYRGVVMAPTFGTERRGMELPVVKPDFAMVAQVRG